MMERPAHLRSVPARPDGPVAAPRAIDHVSATLPALDEPARIALALVELAGRSRAEVAAERGVAEAELAAALFRARKALRRGLVPLPGNGWCERAERLISDELDVELEPREVRLLESHLSRCERCVEHRKGLGQAADALVLSLPAAVAGPTAAPPPEAPDVRPRTSVPEPEPEPELSARSEPEQPKSGVRGPMPNPNSEVRVRGPRPTPDVQVRGPIPKSEVRGPKSDPKPTVSAASAASTAFWYSLIAISALLAIASVVLVILGATGALQHTF